MLYVSYYDSPIGKITLGAREDVLVGAWFEGQKYYMDKIIEDFDEKKDLPVLDQAEYWLDRYLQGRIRIRKNFLLHLQEVISEKKYGRLSQKSHMDVPLLMERSQRSLQ